MAQEASKKEEALPNFEGEMSAPPRGPWLTALLAITGLLLIVELCRLVARYVLVFRRPTEVRLTAGGVEVRGRTFMVGKLLREHATVLPREGLVRVTREVRYPSLAMYAGLIALALGSYLGVGLVVDGVRAASPSMLGTGLLIALLGLGLDFVLSSLVPGLYGKSRVVFVPRRGPVLCVTGVTAARADALLAELAKSHRPASGQSGPAVEAAGADRASDDAERKDARGAR
jgi:hypothetical protein